MEPVCKPPVPIAMIKNFESQYELSSYYIQWLIEKSSNVQNLNSQTFSAGIVYLDDSKSLSFHWQFKYFIDDETKRKKTKSTNISLIRTIANSSEYERKDFARRKVPMVCRLAIMNKITGITKYHLAAFFHSTTIEFNYNWKLSLDEARDLDLLGGSCIVYFWLDLPTKIIGGESPSSDLCNYSGPALLSSDIAALFSEVVSTKTDESEGTSDVVLIIKKQRKEKRRFYCHRNILSARSPVFDTMFTSGERFKEGKERKVDIEDIDGDVMEIVLKYIYTGECPSDMPLASIPIVVAVAEKYMLHALQDEGVRHLINCDVHDVEWADYLTLSKTYNIDSLKNISSLALSSNIRAMGDEEIQEKLSKEAVAELADVAAKRWERLTMKQVKNSKGDGPYQHVV